MTQTDQEKAKGTKITMNTQLIQEVYQIHREHNFLLKAMKYSKGEKRRSYEKTIADLEKISASKIRELNN